MFAKSFVTIFFKSIFLKHYLYRAILWQRLLFTLLPFHRTLQESSSDQKRPWSKHYRSKSGHVSDLWHARKGCRSCTDSWRLKLNLSFSTGISLKLLNMHFKLNISLLICSCITDCIIIYEFECTYYLLIGLCLLFTNWIIFIN